MASLIHALEALNLAFLKLIKVNHTCAQTVGLAVLLSILVRGPGCTMHESY